MDLEGGGGCFSKPKDDDDKLGKHRRQATLRYRWAAAFGLLFLAAVAIWSRPGGSKRSKRPTLKKIERDRPPPARRVDPPPHVVHAGLTRPQHDAATAALRREVSTAFSHVRGAAREFFFRFAARDASFPDAYRASGSGCLVFGRLQGERLGTPRLRTPKGRAARDASFPDAYRASGGRAAAAPRLRDLDRP